MAIRSIIEDMRAPILGKIRLGEKKVSSSGAEYPTTTHYFGLRSLRPEYREAIEHQYGKEPVELDIMFPSDDVEQIIPTWYKWFSGAVKNDRGAVIGGRLRCYGDGPDNDGNPGVAVHLDKADPATRKAPTRPCMGPSCPDYYDGRGRQQCAKTMQVFCMLPLISMYGVFEIDTKSNNSIYSFHRMIRFVQGMNGGVVKGLPFKISRVETVTTFPDPKTGEQRSGKQFIMELHPNEQFALKHGEEIVRKIRGSFSNSNMLLPSPEELLMRPSGDAFALDSGRIEEDEEVEESKKQEEAIATAETVVKDPLVVAAFDALERAMKRKFSDKARLVAVRKKEHMPDIRAAVLEEIHAQIMLINMPSVADTTNVVPETPVTADAVLEAVHTADAVSDGEVM